MFIIIVDNHVWLQKKLVDEKNQDLKPDEGFLKLFANELGHMWSSLATYLTISKNEVKKMMEEVKDLSQEEKGLHMLKQWVGTRGDKATYGKLYRALLTIPLLYYATHADTSVHGDPIPEPPVKQKDCTSGQPTCTKMLPFESGGPASTIEQTSYVFSTYHIKSEQPCTEQTSIPTQPPSGHCLANNNQPATIPFSRLQQSVSQPPAKRLLQEESEMPTKRKKENNSLT